MARLLVVNDDKGIVKLVSIILKRCLPDCQIVTAFDGYEGLKAAYEHQPDLIICDYIMPYMDGREMLRYLYSDVAMRSIQFLLHAPMPPECVTWLETEFGLDIDKHFIMLPTMPRELVISIQALLAEDRKPKIYTIEEGGQRLFTSK